MIHSCDPLIKHPLSFAPIRRTTTVRIRLVTGAIDEHPAAPSYRAKYNAQYDGIVEKQANDDAEDCSPVRQGIVVSGLVRFLFVV